MAKEGNKSAGAKHEVKGPCTDCGETNGSFQAVRRYGMRGANMVRLCEKCNIRV